MGIHITHTYGPTLTLSYGKAVVVVNNKPQTTAAVVVVKDPHWTRGREWDISSISPKYRVLNFHVWYTGREWQNGTTRRRREDVVYTRFLTVQRNHGKLMKMLYSPVKITRDNWTDLSHTFCSEMKRSDIISRDIRKGIFWKKN